MDNIDAFEVNLVSIGGGRFHAFVKDIKSKSDYIRLTFGYTKAEGSKRSIHLLHEYVSEPKYDSGLFLGEFNNQFMNGRRLWIIFETVKRIEGKRGHPLEHFMGLSPPASKWRTSEGAFTPFELKKIDVGAYARLRSGNEVEAGEDNELIAA